RGEQREWLGRRFLFDPRSSGGHEAELRFLQNLVREAAPAVYIVYRLRRLRSRATGMERARIALELHDGVIQTLASIEMRIDVLRRNRSADRTSIEELTTIQRQLRQESSRLRDLVQRLRSVDQDSRTLLERATELVEEFRRETGISAAVVSESNEIALYPVVAHEVLRIIAEALTNVR